MKVYFPFPFYFVKITGNIVTNIHLNSLNTIQSQYADLQTGSEKLHPCDIYHEAKIRYEPSKHYAKKIKYCLAIYPSMTFIWCLDPIHLFKYNPSDRIGQLYTVEMITNTFNNTLSPFYLSLLDVNKPADDAKQLRTQIYFVFLYNFVLCYCYYSHYCCCYLYFYSILRLYIKN